MVDLQIFSLEFFYMKKGKKGGYSLLPEKKVAVRQQEVHQYVILKSQPGYMGGYLNFIRKNLYFRKKIGVTKN